MFDSAGQLQALRVVEGEFVEQEAGDAPRAVGVEEPALGAGGGKELMRSLKSEGGLQRSDGQRDVAPDAGRRSPFEAMRVWRMSIRVFVCVGSTPGIW